MCGSESVASIAIGTPALSAAAHKQSSVPSASQPPLAPPFLAEGALAGLIQGEGAEDREAMGHVAGKAAAPEMDLGIHDAHHASPSLGRHRENPLLAPA